MTAEHSSDKGPDCVKEGFGEARVKSPETSISVAGYTFCWKRFISVLFFLFCFTFFKARQQVQAALPFGPYGPADLMVPEVSVSDRDAV